MEHCQCMELEFQVSYFGWCRFCIAVVAENFERVIVCLTFITIGSLNNCLKIFTNDKFDIILIDRSDTENIIFWQFSSPCQESGLYWVFEIVLHL